MEIGEVRSWPICQLINVKAKANIIGGMLRKKFTTHVNREIGTVDVTRIV